MAYDDVPDGGADHTQIHRDIATALDAAATTAAVAAGYQPLDSDLTAIAALTTTAYGRSLLTLANQAALQAEAGGGGGSLTPGVDYPTSATVTLSSADILALNNTPITLVAAPGAGKYLVLHSVVGTMTGVTTPYVTVDSVNVRVGNAELANVRQLIQVSEDSVGHIVADSIAYTPLSTYENQPIDIRAVDADPTDGDGTLTVTVWYSIEDVPA